MMFRMVAAMLPRLDLFSSVMVGVRRTSLSLIMIVAFESVRVWMDAPVGRMPGLSSGAVLGVIMECARAKVAASAHVLSAGLVVGIRRRNVPASITLSCFRSRRMKAPPAWVTSSKKAPCWWPSLARREWLSLFTFEGKCSPQRQ